MREIVPAAPQPTRQFCFALVWNSSTHWKTRFFGSRNDSRRCAVKVFRVFKQQLQLIKTVLAATFGTPDALHPPWAAIFRCAPNQLHPIIEPASVNGLAKVRGGGGEQ